MIKRYSLFGDPVEHSLSPLIHRLFAEQSQRRVVYDRRQASSAEFKDKVYALRAEGGHGCNITVPHKQAAFTLCEQLTPAAEVAHAVNTIKFLANGQLLGHNTDGSGLVADLRSNVAFDFAGASVLIAGAGGAARGILQPIIACGPKHIVVANRTAEKSIQLVDDMQQVLADQKSGDEALGNADTRPLTTLKASNYEALPANAFTLIINATSSGLGGDRPPLPDTAVNSNTTVYDLSYGKASAPIIDWAKALGAGSCHDGLGMLLEQAADSFYLWEDVRPKTRMIMPRLKEHLAGAKSAPLEAPAA